MAASSSTNGGINEGGLAAQLREAKLKKTATLNGNGHAQDTLGKLFLIIKKIYEFFINFQFLFFV
jgi:hypothetical protein